MKIRLGEALRLKNEISGAIVRMQRKFSGYGELTYGLTSRNGVIEDDPEGTEKFDLAMTQFQRLLAISHTLNDAIDFANKEAGIPSLARRKGNIEAIMKAYESALPLSNLRTYVEKDNVMEEGKTITREINCCFSPFMNKASIRRSLAELRTEKRAIVQTIMSLDIETHIEVPFSYEEIDELI